MNYQGTLAADLGQLSAETFEIEDLGDLSMLAPQELVEVVDETSAGLCCTSGACVCTCSSSTSTSSCCSSSCSSCCSSSTSTI